MASYALNLFGAGPRQFLASSGRHFLVSVVLTSVILLSFVSGAAQSSDQATGQSTGPVKPSSLERPFVPPLALAAISEAGASLVEPARNPPTKAASDPSQPQFRIESTPLPGGSEMLTIFARLDGLRIKGRPAPDVPLLSVVRDTLGDNDPDNDRLRYVWMLTYATPTMRQRVAAAIPFLYKHVESRTSVSGPPSAIIDLANVERQMWKRFFWMGMQHAFFDTYGLPLKVSSRSYRTNSSNYRSAHVMQALAILSNYENLRQRSRNESELLASRSGTNSGDLETPLLPELSPAFTAGEMLELRARLILSGKTLGALFGPDQFRSTVEKRSMNSIDIAGHNWELLRQRAEAEGLYFEPLKMPDGTSSHAILWVSKTDLATQTGRSFNGRFLNITDPWTDERLRTWKGYSEVRYFDENHRPTNAADPQAQKQELVPLALYGLNHPKIPALLVDFRDGLNPKKREVSRRFIQDMAKNVLSLSAFGNLPYFVGRQTFDFVTGRRGMDINQPTRLRSYSELKLLLAFNGSITPDLRSEIEERVESVSINPLSNNNQAEIQLALQQYDFLMEFARQPDGLAAKIERDRRTEMVPLKHGRTAQFFLNLGNVLTFGRYVHRENATPELTARMEIARRVEYHSQFLSEVAKSSPQTEVVWDMTSVRRSLHFLADHGAEARGNAVRAAGALFQRTSDDESRSLCLDVLYRINNEKSRNELLRIYGAEQPGSEWRTAIAERLRKAIAEDARIKPAAAHAMLDQISRP